MNPVRHPEGLGRRGAQRLLGETRSRSGRRRRRRFSLSPSDAGWSKPTHTAVTSSGVKPTNQASLKSWLVPVLPGDRPVDPDRRRRAGAALDDVLSSWSAPGRRCRDRRRFSGCRPAAAARRRRCRRPRPRCRTASTAPCRRGPARCRSATARPAGRLRRLSRRRPASRSTVVSTAPSAAGSTFGIASTSCIATARVGDARHADMRGEPDGHEVEALAQRVVQRRHAVVVPSRSSRGRQFPHRERAVEELLARRDAPSSSRPGRRSA